MAHGDFAARRKTELQWLHRVPELFQPHTVEDVTGPSRPGQDNRRWYHADVDFIVRKQGEVSGNVLLECKFDTYATGNLLYEWVSVDRGPSKALGWGLTARHDWLLYFFIATGELLALHSESLRTVMRDNVERFKSTAVFNPAGYLTWGSLVPVTELVQLMPEGTCFRVNVSGRFKDSARSERPLLEAVPFTPLLDVHGAVFQPSAEALKSEVSRDELAALLAHCHASNRCSKPSASGLLPQSEILNGTWPRTWFDREGVMERGRIPWGQTTPIRKNTFRQPIALAA